MYRFTDPVSKMSHKLAEDSKRYHSHPLLLLPSTPAAFFMVALCSKAGLPVKVVGHALWMKEWAPTFVEQVHSPLGLWRIVKDSSVLPFAVVSFQDQLVNVDDSFHTVIIDGENIRVSPIEAMRALRSKQCISIMFDVVKSAVDCVYVPFFGHLYPAMGGAAYLSLLSGAPIIPAYTVPEVGRKVRVVFGEPILPENYTGADRNQNVFAMTCALFRDFERQLAQAPWHWIYWGNVSHTTLFSDRMVYSEEAMVEELRCRVSAIPALLKVAPVLEPLKRAL